MKILGGRRWKRRWWRRCSTSGRSVAQRGGGGGCGGARKHSEGSRGRRWLRRCSSVAAGAFGEMGKRRGREQGGGMRGRIDRDGTEEEDPRRCAVPRTQAGRQVAWQHGRARASGTRSSSWKRRKMTGEEALVGWAGHLGRQAGQVSGPGSFFSLSLCCFY